MEPGAQSCVQPELAQVAPGLDEGLLLHIGGIFGVREHAIGQGEDPILVTRNEFVECFHIPRLRACHKFSVR
jgi:hypothetical protein